MAEKTGPTVRATETSLTILEAIIELGGGNNTEIANQVEMTKTTVYNHLQTLLDNEYIVKNDGEYDVGLKFLRIGEYARNRHPISQVGVPEIDKLAEQTKEVANLVVEEYGRGVYIYRSKGEEAVHQDTHTGKRVSLHTTAFGQAILAYRPRELVEEIIDRDGLPAQTPNTITDRNEFFAELERVRERGYAFDDEERLEGLRCIAAPVVIDGEAIGAVSISGPRNRMQGERFTEELPDFVTAAANVIEVNMVYQ